MLIFLGWFFAVMAALPVSLGASPSTGASLVKLEIQYELPAAGEVIFVWGVNGWLQIPENIRPPGTVIRQKVMATSMTQKDKSFVLTIHVESGATIDYGFLIKKMAGGTLVELWDGNDSYHLTAAKSEILTVRSARLYQNSFVLMDRAGLLLAVGFGGLFAGLLGTAFWFMRSQSQSDVTREPACCNDVRFAMLVSVLALMLGMAVILRHEMWRDELQAWSIARGSHSLSQLLENARYEGHPPLWHLCLYVLSRFSNDPVFMQLFHLGVGIAAIFVICRYAPFTRWQKGCLVFGYFFFYEYLIVSRNYALGVLALVSFCAIRAKWPNRMLTGAVCLAIMINTSAFGAIIALACGGWILLESFRCSDRVPLMSRAGVVLILGLGLAAAMMQSAPPPDNSPRMLGWNTTLLVEPLERTVTAIWKAYVPLPLTLPHFWNTNLLDEMAILPLGSMILEPRDVQTILSVGLLVIAALMLRRTPSVMLLYLIATGGLLLFMHLKVNHGIRHTGHVFLVLIACLWLSLSQRQSSTLATRRWVITTCVTLLVAVHTLAGALAATTDLILPFSAGKEAAQFIEQHGYADATMVGSKYFIVSTVANYLNHPVYYAESGQFGTFFRWKGPRTPVSPADLVQTARSMARLNSKDVVLIVSYELGVAGAGVPELASFQRSILTEERYWLYLVPYHQQDSSGEANETQHDLDRDEDVSDVSQSASEMTHSVLPLCSQGGILTTSPCY